MPRSKPTFFWTDYPIEELYLSTRTHNAVTRGAGIKTIGQLAAASDQMLRWCPGFGEGALRETRVAVRMFLTRIGKMNDEAIALNKAVRDASGIELTERQTIDVVAILTKENWVLQRA
jgi:DNA-directed RNA polymerase alpha subunit